MAIQWARDGPRERQDSPSLHNLLGKAYQAAGQLDNAIGELRLAAQVAPPQEAFAVGSGPGAAARQDFEQALADLEEGRRQFPEDPSIAVAYGVACYGRRH